MSRMTEEQKQKILREPKEWEKFLSETQKLMKDVETQIAERELDEETEKMKRLLEKQSKILDLQIRESKTELEIEDYKKKAKLPKTTPEARMQIINEVREQILDKRIELETEKIGSDPEPKFLGKSEDGTETVVEIYKTCWNCRKVFKTFKNSSFCNSDCRKEWVSKNQNNRPLVQDEFAEWDGENWDWSRIGSYQENGETFGIFKRVFKS